MDKWKQLGNALGDHYWVEINVLKAFCCEEHNWEHRKVENMIGNSWIFSIEPKKTPKGLLPLNLRVLALRMQAQSTGEGFITFWDLKSCLKAGRV